MTLFSWTGLTLGSNEYFDLKIYSRGGDAPLAVYPTLNEKYVLDFISGRDRFGNLFCGDFAWSIQVAFANTVSFIPNSQTVDVTDWQGFSSPESTRWVFTRNCSPSPQPTLKPKPTPTVPR